jgi:hypothetical protein
MHDPGSDRRAAVRASAIPCASNFRLQAWGTWLCFAGKNGKKGNAMKLTGGCYCGAVRYEAEGQPLMQAQCHCRECQYITGGSPNMFVAVAPDAFKYTKGTPKQFARKDLEKPVTREFCAECGTHVVTRPNAPIVVIKVGTLDDPSQIMPKVAIYTIDKQPFHHVPEGIPAFERLPQR